MQTSDTINDLATALAKAQGQIKGAIKDAENPHFKSKYADLASVWDACRLALSTNGLSVLQAPRGVPTPGGWVIEVETRLLHASGQWMADTLTVPVGKPAAQGLGSALTYARRYALAAFVGIAPEDDDGNAATAAGGVQASELHPEPTVDRETGELLPADVYTITNVTTKDVAGGRVQYSITFNDRVTATSIAAAIGGKATVLWNSKAHVKRTLEYKGKFINLTSLVEHKTAKPELDLQADITPDDSDIAF